MRGLPQKQNARRADKIRLCGHLGRYKKIVKKTYIIYENNKTLIQYQMEIQSENKSYAYDVEDEKTKKEQIVVDGNTIDIIQYELDAGKEEYVAQFVYNDVFYTINATMSEKEFKEFLKNLYFS
ncbi:MAG: DUF4367 domain-containing protein [Coprococcus comes]